VHFLDNFKKGRITITNHYKKDFNFFFLLFFHWISLKWENLGIIIYKK